MEKAKEHNEGLIKDGRIRDIRTLFEQEDDYYKSKRVNNFWNNNYIKYESNGGKNRNLSLDEKLKLTWETQQLILKILIHGNSVNNCNKLYFYKRYWRRACNALDWWLHKFTFYNDAKEVANELFGSLCSKYWDNLEISMTGSDFFYSVQLMYCKCQKVNFKRSGSYIDSPVWIKKIKATINSKDKDDKFFKYAATVALNYEEIKCNPESISNIKLFINKYIWEGINHPP